jgi:hypothetical protein
MPIAKFMMGATANQRDENSRSAALIFVACFREVQA